MPKLRQLDNGASNVVFDGFDVDGAFAKAADVPQQWRQLDLQERPDRQRDRREGCARVGQQLHVRQRPLPRRGDDMTAGRPPECLYAIVVPGMTVKNSRVQELRDDVRLFFTYGIWWVPLPPAYGGRDDGEQPCSSTRHGGCGSWHYYSLYVGYVGPGGGSCRVGRCVTTPLRSTPTSTRPSGRGIVGWATSAAGRARPGSHIATTSATPAAAPARASRPSLRLLNAPLGWINPAAHDFHLTAARPRSTPPTPTTTRPRIATAIAGRGARRRRLRALDLPDQFRLGIDCPGGRSRAYGRISWSRLRRARLLAAFACLGLAARVRGFRACRHRP